MYDNYLVMEAVSNTASFRIPEFHNYHKTLPLPPVTTIVGIVGAALGKEYKEVQDYFERNIFEIGIYGKSNGIMKDLWKSKSWKGNKINKMDRTIVQREYRINNLYTFVFGNCDKVIAELKSAFENSVYALSAGNSDSLLKIISVNQCDTSQKTITQKLENCILLGNHIDKLDIELQINERYVYTSLTSPMCYNLPNSFIFMDNGVRKIKERKEFTFIGNPVKIEKEGFDAVIFKNKIIPIFSHVI